MMCFCLYSWQGDVFLFMTMARWCVSVYEHGKVMYFYLCLWHSDVFLFMIMARWCASVYDNGKVVCFCLCSWQGDVFLFMIMARWCVSVYVHGKMMCLWSWQGDMFLLVAGTMAAWAVQGQRTCSVTRRLAVTWCVRVRASWAPLFYPTWATTTRSPTSGVCVCSVCMYVWCVYIIYMCMVCVYVYVVHTLYRRFCHWHCTNLQLNSLVTNSVEIKVCLCVQNESSSLSVIIFTC